MLRLVRAVLAVRGDHVTLGRLRRGSVFFVRLRRWVLFFDYGAGEKSNPTGAFVAVRRFVARYLLETSLESLVLPTRRNKKTARIINGKNQRERERVSKLYLPVSASISLSLSLGRNFY